MNRKDLLARRQKAEDSFNQLMKQKEQKQEEMGQIDMELNRLQGEWRLLGEQLDQMPEAKKKTSPKAEVLDASGVEGA